jgi:hypothetical protein
MKSVWVAILVLAMACEAAAQVDPRTLWYGTRVDGEWSEIETVGPGGYFVSLALDSQQRPHIAYSTELGGILKYATKNGTWTTETVLDVPYSGVYNSIAITSDGRPVIASNNGMSAGPQGVAISRRDSVGVWTSGMVEPVRHASRAALFVDGGDHEQVANYWIFYNQVHWATYDGATWTDTLVDSDNPGSSLVAAMASDGPRFVYDTDGYRDIKWAKTSGVQGIIDAVPYGSPASIGLVIAVDVDSSDKLHVAYVKNDELWYAEQTDVGWEKGKVADGYFRQLAMAANSHGEPYIVGFMPATGSIMGYFQADGQWSAELVMDATQGGIYQVDSVFPSLAYDPNDVLHFAFDPPMGGAGAMPEPATVVLLTAGVVCLLARRRKA